MSCKAEFLPAEAEADLLTYGDEMSADEAAAIEAQAAEFDARNEFNDPFDGNSRL